MKCKNKLFSVLIVFVVSMLTLSCFLLPDEGVIQVRVHEPNFVGDFRSLGWLRPDRVYRTELRISIVPRGAHFVNPSIVKEKEIYLFGETLRFQRWEDKNFYSLPTIDFDYVRLGAVRIYLRQATSPPSPFFETYGWHVPFLITEIFESDTRLRMFCLNSVNLTIDRVNLATISIYYNVHQETFLVGGRPFENPAAQNDVNFIAVGTNSSMAHSADGAIWTPMLVGPPPGFWSATWLAITYGNDKFVALGDAVRAYSTDGTTWTFSNILEIWNDVIFANGMFVAVGNDGVIAHSNDGVTWSQARVGPENWGGVAFGNGRFLIVGSNGAIAHSNINMTWTTRIVGSEHWSDVIFVNGRFIAVGANGTMAHSTDGITWVQGNIGSANWRSITFGLGRFVVVGNNGAIAHSTDGITWTQTGMGSGNWFGVTFSNNRFVAVGANGAIAHSADGRTWSSVNVGNTTWFGVTRGG